MNGVPNISPIGPVYGWGDKGDKMVKWRAWFAGLSQEEGKPLLPEWAEMWGTTTLYQGSTNFDWALCPIWEHVSETLNRAHGARFVVVCCQPVLTIYFKITSLILEGIIWYQHQWNAREPLFPERLINVDKWLHHVNSMMKLLIMPDSNN